MLVVGQGYRLSNRLSATAVVLGSFRNWYQREVLA